MSELSCYNCVHLGACSDAGDEGFSELVDDASKCKHFKTIADFEEVINGCRDCEKKVKYLRECGLNDKQIEKVIK